MIAKLFKERNVANALRIVIAVGIILIIYQYYFNRSLWIDEASLALNIINKPYKDLLLPLDYKQVAPIGFLLVEKLFVNIFGANEYALRLFPLLSIIASVFLYAKLSRELIVGRLLALTALAMFAINIRSIYYASEIKQYSTEVFMCIAILLSILNLSPDNKKSIIVAAIVGLISIWFSSAAVIVLFVSGIYLIFRHVFLDRKFHVLLPIFCWTVSFAVYYIGFIHHHPHTEYMQSFWASSFFPLGGNIEAIYDFVHHAVLAIYAFHLRMGHAWIVPAGITILGVIFLVIERRHKELYFLLMPISVHLVLSSLRLYPFADRLVLYLMPLTILLYVWGLHYLWKIINKKVISVPVGVIILIAMLAFIPRLFDYPLERQEMRKSIKLIADNIEDNENVYVFGSGIRAFQFYQEKDALLASYNISMAARYYLDVEGSARAIEELKGNTWLIFSYHRSTKPGTGQHPKQMIDWLEDNGYIILSKMDFTGCSVYKISYKGVNLGK